MTVYIFENSCPLCGGDVKGNEKYRYFCAECNMLFERKYLSKKVRKEVPAEEAAVVEEKLEEVQELAQEAEDIIYSEDTEQVEEPEVIDFVASAKSNKMHISTCHFLRKIQKENWIRLESLDEGVKRGYEPCVCIRRKGLMKI
ncbi:MAG: hypothetical protein ACE5DM_00500 [Candidatus Nanoarchaeia archaeon]